MRNLPNTDYARSKEPLPETMGGGWASWRLSERRWVHA